MTKIGFLVLSLALVLTCCVPVTKFETQDSRQEFEGVWTISDYQEEGVKTLKYDGETVTITRAGNIFYLDGPTWFFKETKFKLRNTGSVLEGFNIPEQKSLQEHYPDYPIDLVAAAYGKKTVYPGTLTHRGKSIKVTQNAHRVVKDSQGLFHHVREYAGFYQFNLVRKE